MGTGHADALAAQAAEATRSEAAFASCLEDLWRSEVLPGLVVAEAQAAHWEAERDERADKVRAALREARAAESRWFNAASAVASGPGWPVMRTTSDMAASGLSPGTTPDRVASTSARPRLNGPWIP